MIHLGLGKGITTLFLLRQDDVGSSSRKHKHDAKCFLEDYRREIKKELSASKEARWEGSFFILGRASMALFLTCRSLDRIPWIVMRVGAICRRMIEERNLKLQMSEPYCFPAVKIDLGKKVKTLGDADKVLPVLVFIRTRENVESLVQRIKLTREIKEHVRGFYLGLGMYDVILHLAFRTISELGFVYNLLRTSLGDFLESSTIIGVPQDDSSQQKERMQAASIQRVPFSISAKCIGGQDVVVANRMRTLSRRKQYRDLFEQYEKRQDVVSLRQGYMDVEIRFMSNTVTDAFDLSCEIRRLEGVIDTCTLVGLPCLK